MSFLISRKSKSNKKSAWYITIAEARVPYSHSWCVARDKHISKKLAEAVLLKNPWGKPKDVATVFFDFFPSSTIESLSSHPWMPLLCITAWLFYLLFSLLPFIYCTNKSKKIKRPKIKAYFVKPKFKENWKNITNHMSIQGKIPKCSYYWNHSRDSKKTLLLFLLFSILSYYPVCIPCFIYQVLSSRTNKSNHPFIMKRPCHWVSSNFHLMPLDSSSKTK